QSMAASSLHLGQTGKRWGSRIGGNRNPQSATMVPPSMAARGISSLRAWWAYPSPSPGAGSPGAGLGWVSLAMFLTPGCLSLESHMDAPELGQVHQRADLQQRSLVPALVCGTVKPRT